MENTDWHPADIIAALHKKGTSMASVSRAAGLASPTLANAMTRPWPKGEMLIAEASGTDASKIWPGRYFDKDGKLINRKALLRRQMRITICFIDDGVTEGEDFATVFNIDGIPLSAHIRCTTRSNQEWNLLCQAGAHIALQFPG